MIETLEDLHDLTDHCDRAKAMGVGGQLEAKVALEPDHMATQPEREIAFWRGQADAAGWESEEESHEIEGRHMLTLTWHF